MINNIWTRLKFCVIIIVVFMLPILFACASNIAAKEDAVMPPSIWKVKQATDGCINLTNKYLQWSEDRPKGSKMPFSLSEMVGPFLSYDDRKKITHVGVAHKDGNEITFTFFAKHDVLTKRKYSHSNDVDVSCTSDRVIIKRLSVETKGEATSGTADITYTLFQSENGSLIIHTSIKRIQSVLILFKMRTENEDWARFKAVSDKK